MYLIHLALEPRCRGGHGDSDHGGVDGRRGGSLPADTQAALAGCADETDALEHVTVHRSDPARPVVGFFLRSPCLEEAEAAAERLWRRAARVRPDLGDWHVRRSESPLFVPDAGWPAWPRTD